MMKEGEEVMLRFSELREREVVHVHTGKRLGYVDDLVFDEKNGTIIALVAPGKSRMLGLFAAEEEYTIPWQRVVKVGDDFILVDGVENHLPRRYERPSPRFQRHDSYDRNEGDEEDEASPR